MCSIDAGQSGRNPRRRWEFAEQNLQQDEEYVAANSRKESQTVAKVSHSRQVLQEESEGLLVSLELSWVTHAMPFLSIPKR